MPVVLSDPTNVDVLPRQAIVATRPDNPLFYMVSSIFGAFWSYYEAFLAGKLAREADEAEQRIPESAWSTPIQSDAI